MFVDASALVAILCREEGHARVAACLHRAETRLTSGVALFEAVLAVARLQVLQPDGAERIVDGFRAALGIAPVPIGIAETRVALVAHARYGKGRGHPARLNFGDCFAYACASIHGVPLLFVGEDFSHTDIAHALA